MNGRRVGRLRREVSGAVDFTYDQDWLAWDPAIPVSLSLPLREDRYVGAPVITVFDNLLPDNEAIRGRIAAKVGAQGVDAYSLLTALGRDCVGALQFLPEDADPPVLGRIDGEPLTEADIERLIANLAQAPLGLETEDDFRISLAGAQEKTALLWHEGQWLKPRGATPTTHILKPQIGRIADIDLTDAVENEHLCLALLRAFGLEVAPTEIATFGDRRVLIVERFDRMWAPDGRLLRVPQEDICQALSVPWTRKYESDGGPGIVACLDLLAASDTPTHDRRTFLKTQMLFWLLGATDGHAKNFSLFLRPRGGFHATPLYDVLSTQPSLDAGQIQRRQMKLAMAVGDQRRYRVDELAPRHFLQTAIQAGLGDDVVASLMQEIIAKAPAALEVTRAALSGSVPEPLTASILAGAERRLAQLTRALEAPDADVLD